MNQRHILKVSRLEGLTDGIFAIAMTILALNLSIPTDLAVSNLNSFLMTNIILKLCIYMGSFIILGTLWIGMHFQFGLLDHINRPYLWTHVFYLMAVCVVPFSASFIAAYPNNALAITFYAINLLCASSAQFIICEFAHFYNLNDERCTPAIRSVVIQRIAIAPMAYIAAIVVAHWSTRASFGLLLLPTLIYMLPGKVDKYDS